MPTYKTEALSQGPVHMNKSLAFFWKQDFKEHMFYISRMGKIWIFFYSVYFLFRFCICDLTGHNF